MNLEVVLECLKESFDLDVGHLLTVLTYLVCVLLYAGCSCEYRLNEVRVEFLLLYDIVCSHLPILKVQIFTAIKLVSHSSIERVAVRLHLL